MIELKNVVKKFENFTALNNLNMNIPDEAIYGLVGPNGAGKTTALKLLVGIYNQDEGEVLINNKKVYDDETVKKEMVFISDDLYFFNTYTVLELARFYSRIYKNFSFEKFKKLQSTFNIELKRKLNKLSKGMKKQVAFWIAISCNPKILILDEPIDGLDPIMKNKVWLLLKDEVNTNKTTVVVSSHNLKELEDVCTHLGIIENGKMVLEKNVSRVETDIQKVQIAFNTPVNIQKLELNILKEEQDGSIIKLIIKGTKEEIQEKLKSANPIILDFLPLTLEETFMYKVGGANSDEK